MMTSSTDLTVLVTGASRGIAAPLLCNWPATAFVL